MHSTRSAILATALLALCAGAAVAGPRERAEDFFTLPYDGRMPPCDDGVSLYEISQRFATSETFYANSPLRITGFNAIREYAYRANGAEFIPRRYCVAKASFNDSSVRTIKYTIIERGGLMSFNRGVEWCVEGLDRYRAYAPMCDGVGP
ncbi:hypothetical protein [Rhodoblastus sp.]|uniref:hypothetical protein n=1 Tax=Rhodoblastus sp. TaxID=1962975 RepID=UPI0026120302|nr:hypothetical protein [Rhodoblastus sp.]